ncbi:MAG: hypothetical protein NVSMB65_20340 [Chloroflexota bacterium]
MAPPLLRLLHKAPRGLLSLVPRGCEARPLPRDLLFLNPPAPAGHVSEKYENGYVLTQSTR